MLTQHRIYCTAVERWFTSESAKPDVQDVLKRPRREPNEDHAAFGHFGGELAWRMYRHSVLRVTPERARQKRP